MEILIGVISTGITEIIKILTPKLGVELSKKIVHGVVFTLVFIGALLISKDIISWDIIENYIQIFTTSYTSYNLIVKPVKNKLIK